ncbi:MAG: hypothetical protein ACLQIB_46260 [Isosphaeraceae bacterium]
MTEQSVELVERSLDWLRDHYSEVVLRNESDLVTALWLFLRREACALDPPLRVDYERTIKCSLGTLKCDIVIVSPADKNLVGAEFKFEPCRTRIDIEDPFIPFSRAKKIGHLKHILYGTKDNKFRPDFLKLQKSVEEGQIDVGYAVFIDEGSCHVGTVDEAGFPYGARWTRWGVRTPSGFDTSILMARFPRSS